MAGGGGVQVSSALGPRHRRKCPSSAWEDQWKLYPRDPEVGQGLE